MPSFASRFMAASALAFTGLLTSATAAEFMITKTSGENLKITHDGKPIAEYVVDQSNKPYLWPVYGPTGKAMTRAYPMKTVEGEQHDHPHHRGICFGHESIGGFDNWAEKATFEEQMKSPKTVEKAKARLATLGSIKHEKYVKLDANSEQALIQEECGFYDISGKKLVTEKRTMTFRISGNAHTIDFDQDLIASEETIAFADKKDAGLSIRVPTSMAVDSKQGGKIITSEGKIDAEAWSTSAKWVDYQGPVEGETLGVAMLNHPSSFRYPTKWHVRTYGLFTANPFAQQQYDKTQPDGGFDLKKGDTLKLRHRFVFHKGDEREGDIEKAFQAYAKETR